MKKTITITDITKVRVGDKAYFKYCARAWESLSPARRGTYIVIAGMALEAAREAVSE